MAGWHYSNSWKLALPQTRSSAKAILSKAYWVNRSESCPGHVKRISPRNTSGSVSQSFALFDLSKLSGDRYDKYQQLVRKLCIACFKHYLLVSLFQFVLYIHQCWLDPTSCLSQIYHLLLLKLLVISFFLCLFCVKMTVFNQNWLILIEIFRKLKIILFRLVFLWA